MRTSILAAGVFAIVLGVEAPMPIRQTAIGLVLAFFVGCLVAPMVNQLLIRRAQAAPDGLKKWEQSCTVFASGGYLTRSGPEQLGRANEEIKSRGLDGWELVSVSATTASGNADGIVGIVYCFKRPKL
jgi:hypothetical protein